MQLLNVVLFLGAIISVTAEHLYARDDSTIDTCGYINIDLYDECNINLRNGWISDCLCVSGVSDYAHSNTVAKKAADYVGYTKVISVLKAEIIKAGKVCHFPDHSAPTCTLWDPCSFGCTDGFTKENGTCKCKKSRVCNGVCTNSQCSSQRPRALRQARNGRTLMQTLTDERCAPGLSLCGAPIAINGEESWECIDTSSTLDSCGGCSIPYHFDNSPSRAVDCTALPGVEAVDCVQGGCLVSSCKHGWSVAPTADGCVADEE